MGRRLALLGVASLIVASCGAAVSPATTTTTTSTSTTEIPPVLLVDVLEQRTEFSTFVDLARRAGLEATLRDGGPLTLFVPTNAAFAAVDDDTLARLSGDPEELRNVLLYHMIANRVPSSAVTGPGFATTMAGFNLDITPTEQGLLANEVTISEVDIEADNGLIHVVDNVLFIPSILDVLRQSGTFTQLLDALTDDQRELLDSEGPFTFFATNDVAFAGREGGTFREILANPAAVDAWFFYHLVDGVLELEDLRAVPEIQTLFGVPLPIGERGQFTTVAGAEIVITDVPASNGVIQIVDDLYFPPEPETDGGDEGQEGEELEE